MIINTSVSIRICYFIDVTSMYELVPINAPNYEYTVQVEFKLIGVGGGGGGGWNEAKLLMCPCTLKVQYRPSRYHK